MSETIGVFVAWPYANGDLHLGHVAGAYLPPDIFARYHRLRGNRVLMVSGSDSHGTPITLKASEQGTSPRDVFTQYHRRFLENWQTLGVSFDLFTHTDTENHFEVSQDIFRTAYDNDAIYIDTDKQLYCENDEMFLPDRYVEGTCPHCDYPNARGDQCDNCGRTLDAVELGDPRCKLCGETPVVRETEHFYFDLPAFEQQLSDYIETQEHWRPNVQNFVRNYLSDGLKARAVSRDIEWGIPVPVDGYEDKVMYVWFEAVIGYLSASVEWAKNNGAPDAWETWWKNEDAQAYYFIGKDNIPFHAIIWPAELLAYDNDLNLPYDIPANEFLNLEGQKLSTSRNWAIWLPEFLERYDADPLRYYLTAIAPQTRDSDFTWKGFVDRNNNELVAAWGNLVNRVLGFAYKRFDGHVPEPGEYDERDQTLLDQIAAGFEDIGALYEQADFKTALQETMTLTREVNKYLDDKAPWFQIKEDTQAAATTIYVALAAIDSLKVLFAPVLPFASEKVQQYLGYEEPLFGELTIEEFVEDGRPHEAVVYHPLPAEGRENRWQPSELQPGQALERPHVLFQKLDESVANEELERLREKSTASE